MIITGPIDYYTGFGRLTCHLIQQLVKRGIGVTVFPTNNLDRRIALPVEVEIALATGCFDSGNPFLVCVFPELSERVKLGDVVLTMCESTSLDPVCVEALNARAKVVIVPSTWCASVFLDNGVTAPIKVVPLGVDNAIYKPGISTCEETTQFGASGRLYYSGKRKGIDDVISAFRLAFPGERDVHLSLKLFDDCIQPELYDERITIIDGALSDEQMASWYQSLSCFVSASKGEGWGLQVHEAIMCGIPVIAPAYSGLADLVAPGIDFQLIDATEGCYSGKWCQPSIEQIIVAMQKVKIGTQFGFALPIAQTYTVELFADNILKIINQ